MIAEYRRHALNHANGLSWPMRARLLLLIPGDHRWNGWVRDWTARLERLTTPRGVGEGGAVFAFGAWLTSREQESGPFSRRLPAQQMAELCGTFCQSQGWDVDADTFPKGLKAFPEEPPTTPAPPDSRVRFDRAEWAQRN